MNDLLEATKSVFGGIALAITFFAMLLGAVFSAAGIGLAIRWVLL